MNAVGNFVDCLRQRLRELEDVVECSRQREINAAEEKREHATRLLADLQKERSQLCDEVEQARLETHRAERGVEQSSSRDDENVFQAQQLAGTQYNLTPVFLNRS